MNDKINELKINLLNNNIKIEELSNEEVKILIEEFSRDIELKFQKLDDVNQKIKKIKEKIENWNN